MTNLTIRQAYEVALLFLEEIWAQNRDEYAFDLPGLLSEMQFLSDGETANPAIVAEWEDAVPQYSDSTMSAQEAFDSMVYFLQMHPFEEEEDKARLLNLLQPPPENIQNTWLELVRRVKTNG